MRRNTVKERLARGEATLGCFLGLGSPTLAELFAQAGFDWLVIETEHNALDTAEIQTMLMAINGTDAVPLVRVPSSDHVAIQRALDVGAMGVVVPLVRSAAEVEAVVRATRYPPAGRRSFGPLRASRYGLDNASYLAEADDNMLVVVILETLEAVAELDEIARVDGLDGIWLGLFDLCLAMGLDPLQLPHPQIDEVIARALAVGREANVAIGQNAFSPAMLRERLDEGCRMVGFGPDYQAADGTAGRWRVGLRGGRRPLALEELVAPMPFGRVGFGLVACHGFARISRDQLSWVELSPRPEASLLAARPRRGTRCRQGAGTASWSPCSRGRPSSSPRSATRRRRAVRQDRVPRSWNGRKSADPGLD